MSTFILASKSTDDRVSKFKKNIRRSKRKCYKRNDPLANQRVLLLNCEEKLKEIHFDIDPKIIALTKIMGKLTGMISTKKNSGNIGTCFLQKIRRLKNEKGESTDRAVFTFTTVYHVFCVRDGDFYKLQRNWKDYEVRVYLFYDSTVKDLFMKSPVLQNFRLLDTDKEEGVENDWCAIECEVDCGQVFKTEDEERNLVDTLVGYLEDYRRKQKEIYDLVKNNIIKHDNLVIIVGHPHGLPKQVSVGLHFQDLKDEPKKVRNSQLWCRYYYDAPTCGASSGSPVLIPGQPIAGFGFWFGHQHNHKKKVSKTNYEYKYEIAKKINPKLEFLGMSSIGVELC